MIRNTLLALVVLGFAPVAYGATLVTSGASVASQHTMFCVAINVSKSALDITMETVTYGGSVTDSAQVNVPAGQGAFMNATDANAAFCRFDFKGGRKRVRAHALYRSTATFEYTMSVPAQ